MKVIPCQQGTQTWLELRGGIPTSSRFADIITPTGKPSGSVTRYMHELLAERLMGRPLIGYQSIDMSRGKDLEPEAIAYYEFTHDVTVKRIGFITNDEGTIGCSPDGLVGDLGLIEAKCPSEHVHVGYLLRKPVDKAYRVQLQGQLWLCEREWVDNLSYHPDMPHALVRVERDEKFIKLLAGAVTSFSMDLEAAWEKLSAEYQPVEKPAPELYTGDLWLQREDVPL